MKNIKTKFKYLIALTAILFGALFGGIFTLSPLNASAATGDFAKYPANTKVGYYAEYLGTVERQKPEVKNEGKTNIFPTYGETLYGEGSSGEKSALWAENSQLISEGLKNATNCFYDGIDKDGNLYLKGAKLERKLYKHDASKDMYYGNVAGGEEAVIKRISYRSRTYGNLITGLYAPAGEVITLDISSADLQACGGLTVFIGQVFSDGSANVTGSTKAYNRMPCIATAMKLTAETATSEEAEDGTVSFYFGSFLGGPIYLAPVKGGASFTVTVSGGVRYSHFILGYTTEEEFSENASSSAPYFDLEVWDRGVRHSGPKKYAESYTYSQLYDVAVFWEKAANLASQFTTNTQHFDSSYGVDFIYDPSLSSDRVPLNTLNCPDSWLSEELDYQTIINEGSNILSRYNSRFTERMGLTGDDATADAISLIDYSLYTQISSRRDLFSEDEGMEGIAKYLSASLALKQLKTGAEGNLAFHATVLHSFGQDAYISAVKANASYSQGTDRWFRSLTEATKHDMTYYFTELCGITISESTLEWAHEKNYPMFVPATCIYQTGGVYGRDGESVYFKTVQPYSLNFGTPYEIDFDKVLELPYGFSYKIKSVSSPENGSLSKVNSHTYNYKPRSIAISSGEIYVNIGIRRDDNSFEVEDKILILEFRNEEAETDTFVSENAYKDLNNTEEIKGANGTFTRYSPDGITTNSVDITVKQTFSTFGHIYEGEKGSALEFSFYGTQFAIYCNFAEGYGEFEIYIDGGKTPVATVKLGDRTELAGLAYLLPSTLAKGRHTVKITGTGGTFNIDSISLKLQADPATLPRIPDLTPDEGTESASFRKPLDHPDRVDDNDDNPEGKDYTGLIIGLSAGGVLIAGGIAAFFIVKNSRKKRKEKTENTDSDSKSSEE